MGPNCFNAVQLYFQETKVPQFLGPAEFVSYLASKFQQVQFNEADKFEDVFVIWSRSDDSLPIGEIKILSLEARESGYPFGLVLEHAFVLLEDDSVFQKRDPTAESAHEIISRESALAPYLSRWGFEVTKHRLKNR